MRVLVTGGARYRGSHAAAALRQADHQALILDNLHTGHAEAARRVGCELIVGDVGDQAQVEELLRSRRIEVVLHFAAASLVGQSMVEPER
ncbi:MAG: NAD-dependent epimerase/dehydratase family protein [Betaproteobacteria bacterium]